VDRAQRHRLAQTQRHARIGGRPADLPVRAGVPAGQLRRYYFNRDAIRQPLARPEALAEGILIGRRDGGHARLGGAARRHGHSVYGTRGGPTAGPLSSAAVDPSGRRHAGRHPPGEEPRRCVVDPTRPLHAAYYAAFPIDLPDRCIAAGCRPGGVVLEPFSGSGTTGLAALAHGARYIGIDLNPDFHQLANCPDIAPDAWGR
jgi:site-specific DNA-methyltransferase (cytosine-N4-specific)